MNGNKPRFWDFDNFFSFAFLFVWILTMGVASAFIPWNIPLRVAVGTAGALVVFWIAHLYALIDWYKKQPPDDDVE